MGLSTAIYGMLCIETDHGWMEVKVQMVHLDLLVNSLYLQKKAKNARHGSQKNKMTGLGVSKCRGGMFKQRNGPTTSHCSWVLEPLGHQFTVFGIASYPSTSSWFHCGDSWRWGGLSIHTYWGWEVILSVPEVLAQCGGHQEQLNNVIIRARYFSDQYEGCFTTKQRNYSGGLEYSLTQWSKL